jgi:hypothetical protein
MINVFILFGRGLSRMKVEVKEICKALHLAYITDRFEEVGFETKEQFLRDCIGPGAVVPPAGEAGSADQES